MLADGTVGNANLSQGGLKSYRFSFILNRRMFWFWVKELTQPASFLLLFFHGFGAGASSIDLETCRPLLIAQIGLGSQF